VKFCCKHVFIDSVHASEHLVEQKQKLHFPSCALCSTRDPFEVERRAQGGQNGIMQTGLLKL